MGNKPVMAVLEMFKVLRVLASNMLEGSSPVRFVFPETSKYWMRLTPGVMVRLVKRLRANHNEIMRGDVSGMKMVPSKKLSDRSTK